MDEQELLAAWRGERSRLDRWWRIWVIPVSAVAAGDSAGGVAVASLGFPDWQQVAWIIAVQGVIAVAACLWIAWEAVR